MVDSKKLKKIIKERGVKYGFLTKQLGIGYSTLKRKIENKADFKASEILELCQLLDIEKGKTLEIFLHSK